MRRDYPASPSIRKWINPKILSTPNMVMRLKAIYRI